MDKKYYNVCLYLYSHNMYYIKINTVQFKNKTFVRIILIPVPKTFTETLICGQLLRSFSAKKLNKYRKFLNLT